MIIIKIQKALPFARHTVFGRLEDFESLSRVRGDIGRYRIVRSEPGLQIVDADVLLPFFIRAPIRLKYTTIPVKYAELKRLKGALSEYECRYSLTDSNGGTMLAMDLSIRFRVGPLEFFISPILRPLMKRRMAREVKLMEKKLLSGQ
jgi:hypothetical protein